MFKPKNTYPPGTFLPTPTRTLAIIQLCLAFSLLMWVLCEPFTEAYFSHRSNQLLFQAALHPPELFEALPSPVQSQIQGALQAMEQQADLPFSAKAKQSLMLLFVYLPSFQQAWLLFAIVISVMLLKRREGAQVVAWVLPLLALCYAIDNSNVTTTASPDTTLFPTEGYLVTRYLDGHLSDKIGEQQTELTSAWQRYLITEWAQQQPSNDPSLFSQQLQQGQHAFHTKRLLTLLDANALTKSLSAPQAKSLAVLTLYVLWNLFFAAFVNRKRALQ